MVQGPVSNRIVYWNDKDGGFSTSGEFQSTLFHSVNPKNNVISGFRSCEAVTKRIKLSTEFSQQEVDVNSSEESSPLGLTLRKTPSFLSFVEMKLSQARKTKKCSTTKNHGSDQDRSQAKIDDFVSQPMSEKLKASNFPASLLKIGSWERISRHEGDLIAKCYFAKRKLVWEVLEGALKSKIEIQWTDILAIKATIRDDEPGILEIELNQPPLFFRETNPQPRKHTLWQPASDFTGGQAPIFRRHYIKFPPGTLDKHYEKLLQCDQHLFMLSQKPFPSLESPYFYSNIYESTGFSFDFSGCNPEFPPGLTYPFPPIFTPSLVPPHQVQNFKPPTIQPFGITDSNSPMSVMDFPPTDENVNNYTAVWGQAQANAGAFPCEDYGVLNYADEARRPNPNTGILNDIENHLLGDSQVLCSDERSLLARVRSMCSLLEPAEERNGVSANELAYKQENGMLFNPQPISCLPPQASDENLMMHLQGGNSLYRYVFSDPTAEDFAAVDAVHEACQWT